MNNPEEILECFKKQFEIKLKRFVSNFNGIVNFTTRVLEHIDNPSFVTLHEFDLESKSFQKILKFSYSTGINVDSEVFHFFDFRVEYSGQNKESIKRDSFFLPDYYQHIGKKFKKDFDSDKKKHIYLFFKKINDALFKYGMSEMLCQESWTSIQINFDEYK